jgi:molybdopterin-guanine dinucleotide biosynthesis protein A
MSLRLGHIKALERIGQQSLIERTIDGLSRVSQSTLIVTSQEQLNPIAIACSKGRVVVDIYPDKAALGGIYTGLMNADTDLALVVGCDMPFLNPSLLQHLVDISADFDVVVPRIGNMVEPLHAIYSRRCLTSIEHLLHQNTLAVSQLFELVKTRFVGTEEIDEFDPGHLSFFNINTQSDLRKARSLIRQMGSLD